MPPVIYRTLIPAKIMSEERQNRRLIRYEITVIVSCTVSEIWRVTSMQKTWFLAL